MAIPKLPEGPKDVTLDNASDKFLEHAEKLLSDPEEMEKRNNITMGNPISLAPAVITEDEWLDKQMTRTTAAAGDWEKNSLKPRRDPKAAAIAANEKRKQNLEEAERKGKWLKSMENVDLEARQETIKAVGATGFKRGVEARRKKIANKIKIIRPLILANKETIQNMPDATPEDRENRMIANLRNMRKVGDIARGIS